MPKKPTVELTPALKEAVLLLRFHKKKPVRTDPQFMPYASIASHLAISYQ